MPDTVTVTNHRTGGTHQIAQQDGAIRCADLRAAGLLSYDPAFLNTASCRSSITYLDGERGILRYRGYPIEELAERCNFLEVAYLLLHGQLPSSPEMTAWRGQVARHTMIHENIKKFMDGFHYDAHPMGMLTSTVAALSTFYPDAKAVHNPQVRALQILRLLGKMPTLAAYAYRHSLGLPYVYPDNDLSYTENFMNMLWKKTEPKYAANPVLARALDVLFILHADHEQNCSTNVMRAVGSSEADPFVATASASAALYGPLHGGANEAVLNMLDVVGSKERVPAYIKAIKTGHGRLMGFGHRVYKNYDPRARIIKRIAEEVFEVTGRNPKLDTALEIERIALEDDFFIERKLYPNVDFYSGIIYQAMGFAPEMFTVMFAIPRTAGWLAQWQEMIADPEQKIARPRQVYTGEGLREFVPMERRAAHATAA